MEVLIIGTCAKTSRVPRMRNPPKPPQKTYQPEVDNTTTPPRKCCNHSNSEPMPRVKGVYGWRYCKDCEHPYKAIKTPPPPPPPLSRIMRDGVSVFCEDCGSTKSRIGIFGLIGKRYCDNDECKNSLLQDKFRKYQ